MRIYQSSSGDDDCDNSDLPPISTPASPPPNGDDGDDEWTKIGRWMSREEYDAMIRTGRVQEGAGGQTYGATTGPGSYIRQAKPGTVYVEFEVPTSSLLRGGKPGWVKMIGPNSGRSMQRMLQKQGGQMLPKCRNISDILKIK